MKQFNTKFCYGGGYNAPSLRFITINAMKLMCASNGDTENYTSSSIWDDTEADFD